jgi:hypothetical protein
MDKGEISPELIDVFCEKDVFDIECTRKILQVKMKMIWTALVIHRIFKYLPLNVIFSFFRQEKQSVWK